MVVIRAKEQASTESLISHVLDNATLGQLSASQPNFPLPSSFLRLLGFARRCNPHYQEQDQIKGLNLS